MAKLTDLDIIGISLGGDERRFPAELFSGVFEYARSQGLHCVAHAGEAGDAKTSATRSSSCAPNVSATVYVRFRIRRRSNCSNGAAWRSKSAPRRTGLQVRRLRSIRIRTSISIEAGASLLSTATTPRFSKLRFRQSTRASKKSRVVPRSDAMSVMPFTPASPMRGRSGRWNHNLKLQLRNFGDAPKLNHRCPVIRIRTSPSPLRCI